MDAYIKDFKKQELPRLNKLAQYYLGDQKIKRRTAAYGKPNNRIVHPYGNYIVDINVGYFLGEAIALSAIGVLVFPMLCVAVAAMRAIDSWFSLSMARASSRGASP